MATERWSKIAGFESYEASDMGRIRSIKFGKTKILRPHQNEDGYSKVILFHGGGAAGKCVSVHRAMWLAFRGEIPFSMEVDHIDHDCRNNRLENLQILTPIENKKKAWDGIRTGERKWPKRKVSA